MIKSELVKRISDQNPHLYRRDVEKIIEAILDGITAALARGDRVELRDFGTFSVRRWKSRIAQNPQTGVAVTVESKAHAFFKSGKEIRTRLNRLPV